MEFGPFENKDSRNPRNGQKPLEGSKNASVLCFLRGRKRDSNYCRFLQLCVMRFSDFAKTSQNASVFALKGSRFGGFPISGDSDPPKVSKYDNKYVCFALLRFSLKTRKNISFHKEIKLCTDPFWRPGDFRLPESSRSVTFFASKR